MFKNVISMLMAACMTASVASMSVAMPIAGNTMAPMHPELTKVGIVCGPGRHLAGLICVPNRPFVHVCPRGWHLGPAGRACVRY